MHKKFLITNHNFKNWNFTSKYSDSDMEILRSKNFTRWLTRGQGVHIVFYEFFIYFILIGKLEICIGLSNLTIVITR